MTVAYERSGLLAGGGDTLLGSPLDVTIFRRGG